MATNGLESLEIDPKKQQILPEKDENSNDLLEMISNLKDEECIRGSTPQDIEKRCLTLTQTYIGGSWNNATSTEDIEVSRITGGLTNQLYRVKLNPTIPRVDYNPIYPKQEPTDVAIKLYQPKHFKSFHEDDAERLNDIVVLTITSQEGLGPKVFGIFDDGMIQEYHPCETFGMKHQQSPEKLRQLAHLLARVHHLEVPVRKNHDWSHKQIDDCFQRAYKENNAEKLIEKLGLELLKSKDPRIEFQDLYKIIHSLKAPFVFCHNDFRGSNILVTEPDDRILLVDLEYSAYGYRGFDIGGYLNEWGHESFDFDKHQVPEDAVIKNFIQLYIEGCERVVPGYSARSENLPERILREVKISALSQYLFFVAFMMQQKDNLIEALPFNPESNMKFCEFGYKKYFDLKERFINDGTIEK